MFIEHQISILECTNKCFGEHLTNYIQTNTYVCSVMKK